MEAKKYYDKRIEELNITLKKVQKKYRFFTFFSQDLFGKSENGHL